MKIRRKSDCWIGAFVISVVACMIVASAVLLIYPREDWAFELTLSLSLTVAIAMPVTFFMATQMRKTYLLSKELQRLVNKDLLTNLASRRYFFGQMENMSDTFGTTLMVDIDHFKSINDNFGHQAGDVVIREVAGLLDRIAISDRIVARFGGEEFVIFMPDTNEDEGFSLAEQVRCAIARACFTFENQSINVTVSIGAAIKKPGVGINRVIKAADAALYRAKQTGRNRTVFTNCTDPKMRVAS